MGLDLVQLLLDKAAASNSHASIQDWLTAKKIKSTDLSPIQSLKADLHWKLFVTAITSLIELKASYSESIKTIDLITDLILMGHSENLFEKATSYPIWADHLYQLRYPATVQRDEQLKQKYEALPWPYGSKTKFERRGDRSGIELKVFITSEADLIKVMSSLERVQQRMKDS